MPKVEAVAVLSTAARSQTPKRVKCITQALSNTTITPTPSTNKRWAGRVRKPRSTGAESHAGKGINCTSGPHSRLTVAIIKKVSPMVNKTCCNSPRRYKRRNTNTSNSAPTTPVTKTAAIRPQPKGQSFKRTNQAQT